MGLQVSLRHFSYNTLLGQSPARRFRMPIVVLNPVNAHTVYVDLPETKVLRVRGVPRLIPLLTFPLCRSRRWSTFYSSRNAAGCCSVWGCLCVSTRSVLLCLALRLRLWLLFPRTPAPPLSLPRPCLPCDLSPICPLLDPSILRRDVGTLPQTLAGHESASCLAALTSRGLAR